MVNQANSLRFRKSRKSSLEFVRIADQSDGNFGESIPYAKQEVCCCLEPTLR